MNFRKLGGGTAHGVFLHVDRIVSIALEDHETFSFYFGIECNYKPMKFLTLLAI